MPLRVAPRINWFARQWKQHAARTILRLRCNWAVAAALIVSAIFLLLLIGHASNQMSESPYRWEELTTPSGEIVALEFASADKGWASELSETRVEGGETVGSKYHGAITHLKRTLDGGRTWTELYTNANTFERLRYDGRSKTLMAIRVSNETPNGPFRLTLVGSDDDGAHWEECCELPDGAEDYRFLDVSRGYAWTLMEIYATWDGGAQWQQIAVMDSIGIARTENIGPQGIIYFIQSHQVIGKDPWQHTSLAIPLPKDFEPRMLSASQTENLLFVLGRHLERWSVLTWRDNHVVALDEVPPQDGWEPEVFVYSGGILNLVSADRSYLRRYRFQVRDREGWHLQSISGKRNFEQFAFWGGSAWATRIALLAGRRQLWYRPGRPSGVAGQDE